ncbi:hypothetical protein FACS189413_00270 [Bacteroidia bacterium]|nr:hypothetical protein FACS189413_00270 [Bacteroidia bacterium]
MNMKRIYPIILFFVLFSSALFAAGNDNPTTGLTEIANGFTSAGDGNHTIHLYTANGKLTRGYNEIFIATTDSEGYFVDDFLYIGFTPLMNMGAMKHSTPIGKVEKVEGKALYKTWFSFLMAGSWILDINYTTNDLTEVI